MHRPSFGRRNEEDASTKKKQKKNEEDADTGSPDSLTAPAEANSGGSISSPMETDNVASCSSLTENCYEVFLSFRGPDTRHGFTDHLYHGLRRFGINVFRDDDELCQGEHIRPKLMAAIANSKILIPIFSESYGTSSWCLDELVEIMERKNNNYQIVLPIFYKVKPSDVGHQIGSFGKLFLERAKRLLERSSQDLTNLEKWKKALDEVSTVKGYEADGSEVELVNSVVQRVFRELKKNDKLVISENLVGIESHVKKIMKFLHGKSNASLFVGIHGMGGIGKTTLAKAIYNELSNQFECCSFIADIRESGKSGVHQLQNQLIYDILKEKNEVHNEDDGIKFISSRLKDKKVLVVLDDVDNVNQVKRLIGNHDWFSLSSRIIITTRNERILKDAKVDYEYNLKEMDYDQSLILFSKHAFRMDSPPKDFENLTREVVKITGGLPLCLEVFGSLFCGKASTEWREKIEKLEKVPDTEVQKRLRISYNALEHEQKQIFLDIACFFIGTDKRITSYMWKACEFFPGDNIEKLKFMSLIKIENDCELRMHDQLRDLGRAIVRENCEQQPWRRSRLWDSNEALKKVLKKNKGTKKIEAIDLSKGSSNGNIYTDKQFKNLTSLRFLHMEEGARLIGDFEDSLDELKWLRWEDCPMNFEVNNFHPTELAILELPRSAINETWQGWSYFKMAEKLKFLDLSFCRSLETTDFLSAFKNLEVLILDWCGRLRQIDSSIGDMKALCRLELRLCGRLTELPAEIVSLQNLEILNISHSGIRELPKEIGRLRQLRELRSSDCKNMEGEMLESIGSLENLEILDISRTGIRGLPNYIGRLKKLKQLRASQCKNMRGEMPESIWSLENLEILDISSTGIRGSLNYIGRLKKLRQLRASRCENMEGEMPESIGSLENLKILNISWSDITGLPNSIGGLRKLQVLQASYCKNLKGKMPESMRNLSSLQRFDVYGCWGLPSLPDHLPSSLTYLGVTCQSRKLPSLSHLTRLKVLRVFRCEFLECIQELPPTIYRLELSGCASLTVLPADSIVSLQNLETLDISYSGITELPKEIGRLRQLRELKARSCRKMKGELPESIGSLENLEILDISWSCIRKLPNSMGGLRKLRELKASYCEELQSLPESMCNLSSLQRFDVGGCKKLQSLPDNLPSSLTDLAVTCQSRILPSLSHLTRLKVLRVTGCRFLECIPEFPATLLKNSECSQLTDVEESELPQSLNTPFKLERLAVTCCESIEILDVSQLIHLRNLNTDSCKSLLEVRGLDRLTYLVSLTITVCNSRLELPQFERLKILNVCNCENLVEIQGLDRLVALEELRISKCALIERLDLPKSENLKRLGVTYCKSLIKIQGLDKLEFLEELDLTGCTSIESLPILCCFDSLRRLTINCCDKLQDIQSLERFPSCESLWIEDCKSLVELPNLSSFHNLQKLFLSNCHELQEIPGLEESVSLKCITISGCSSIEILPDLSSCTRLISLIVQNCEQLTELRGLEKLDHLEEWDISGCKSLKTIPELSGTQLYQNYEKKPFRFLRGTIEFGFPNVD